MTLKEGARPLLSLCCVMTLACAPAAQSDSPAPSTADVRSAAGDDALAWLTGEPLDTRAEPCSACGANKQEVLETRCSPGGKCRQLLRCTKCGVLSLQSEPREGMMILGEEGPEAIMGPGDRLLHGDEALAYLADHGLRGLALFRKPSGRLAVLGKRDNRMFLGCAAVSGNGAWLEGAVGAAWKQVKQLHEHVMTAGQSAGAPAPAQRSSSTRFARA